MQLQYAQKDRQPQNKMPLPWKGTGLMIVMASFSATVSEAYFCFTMYTCCRLIGYVLIQQYYKFYNFYFKTEDICGAQYIVLKGENNRICQARTAKHITIYNYQ